jgi:hypothetical protein
VQEEVVFNKIIMKSFEPATKRSLRLERGSQRTRTRRVENYAMKISTGLLAFVLLLGVIASGDPNQEGGKYSVAAIHAHLYYHATGKINPTDLLDGRNHALWNTIIGEGEAGEPSAAIMVLVDITGPGFLRCEGRLRLTATALEPGSEDVDALPGLMAHDKKTLLDQTLELGLWFNEGGKVILPFLVCGTGCETVEITATLENMPATKVDTGRLAKTIPFKCGE